MAVLENNGPLFQNKVMRGKVFTHLLQVPILERLEYNYTYFHSNCHYIVYTTFVWFRFWTAGPRTLPFPLRTESTVLFVLNKTFKSNSHFRPSFPLVCCGASTWMLSAAAVKLFKEAAKYVGLCLYFFLSVFLKIIFHA